MIRPVLILVRWTNDLCGVPMKLCAFAIMGYARRIITSAEVRYLPKPLMLFIACTPSTQLILGANELY